MSPTRWASAASVRGDGRIATSSSANGAVYANRLMQAGGRITGLLRKAPADATPEQANNDAALRAALEQQAAARQSR